MYLVMMKSVWPPRGGDSIAPAAAGRIGCKPSEQASFGRVTLLAMAIANGTACAVLPAMRIIKTIAAALVLSVAVAGCVTVYEGKYDLKDGWRQAEVLKVGAASDIIRGQSSDCRLEATPQQLSSGRFALLSYVLFARNWHRVVPLRPGQVLAAGDPVYLNVRSCNAAVEPRSR
jgi:hypothetical protein